MHSLLPFLSLLPLALSGPVERRQATTTFTPAAYCSTYSDANILKSASKSFDASEFCYWYMQPTDDVFVILSSSVLSTTITSTYQTYTTTTTTSTDFATSTVVALCPSPTSSSNLTCGLAASGNANNQISSDWDPTNGYTCQQSCLANSACRSFQTVPENNGAMQWLICNLYNADVNSTAFPMEGSGTMWDRDCGDFLPAGCNSPSAQPSITTVPTTTITTAASLTSNAALEERQQSIAYPSFLSLGEEAMYFACLCLTTPAPTTTQTVTLVVPIYSETTISQTSTQVNTVTSAPNFVTTLSSVAS